MQVAIIHDWLTGMRGGEKVLEVFCEIFPEADIFTLIHVHGSVSRIIEGMRIRTSFLQRMPLAKRRYRSFLPLFPLAVEGFDLSNYDVVLSSSHCVAKGVLTPPSAVHVCYCHTPMRYVWDQYNSYFGGDNKGLAARLLMPVIANYLRMWDVTSSNRVDYFIANSHHVSNRIKNIIRDQPMLSMHPWIALFYTVRKASGRGLLSSRVRLCPYKRIDVAVDAFEQLGLPLIIAGSGQEEEHIRGRSKKHVQCVGWQSDESLREYYQGMQGADLPG